MKLFPQTYNAVSRKRNIGTALDLQDGFGERKEPLHLNPSPHPRFLPNSSKILQTPNAFCKSKAISMLCLRDTQLYVLGKGWMKFNGSSLYKYEEICMLRLRDTRLYIWGVEAWLR